MSSGSLDAQLRALAAGDDTSTAVEQLSLEVFDEFASPVEAQLQRRRVEARAGPGRPMGSKNRANLDLVRLIKATKRPTLLAIKELVDLPFEDFVQAHGLGSDRLGALNAWFRMAELMAAYEEGRPTQRLEVKGKGLVPVVFFGGEAVDPALADGNPPDDAAIEVTDYTVNDESSSTNDKA